MPLLTTRASASSRAFGFTSASGGLAELELLGRLQPADNTSIATYTLSVNTSLYKGYIVSGPVVGGTSSGWFTPYATTTGGDSTAYSMSLYNASGYLEAFPDSIFYTAYGPSLGATDPYSGIFMIFGNMDSANTVAVTFDSNSGSEASSYQQLEATGRLQRVGGTAVGFKFTNSGAYFGVGTNLAIYGIKAA